MSPCCKTGQLDSRLPLTGPVAAKPERHGWPYNLNNLCMIQQEGQPLTQRSSI